MSVVAATSAGILAFFSYVAIQIRYPGIVPEDTAPSHFLISSTEVHWPSAGGAEAAGWWTAGVTGAPAILLVPGYDLSRSDVLSLAAVLRQRGFHSLACATGDGSGSRWKAPRSVGPRATEEVLAALEFMMTREGIAAGRAGIWGTDAGARAALSAAALRPEVAAVAADSAFDRVSDFLRIKILSELGYTNRWVEWGCLRVLAAFERSYPSAFDGPVDVEGLADRRILFLEGGNRQEMLPLADALYQRFATPGQRVRLPAVRIRLMRAEVLAPYDKQVADFFTSSLGKVRPAGGAGR
ncbi:MAG: hypothetical protein FJW35_01265 [Acidobacteria bacterium]|nr:hypothetical protein [Acidobacteriota bacterium]